MVCAGFPKYLRIGKIFSDWPNFLIFVYQYHVLKLDSGLEKCSEIGNFAFLIVKIFFIFQNVLEFECFRTVQNIFHFAKFSHIGKMLSDWQNVGVKLPIFAGGPTSFRCCFRHLTKFNKNHTATFFLLIS